MSFKEEWPAIKAKWQKDLALCLTSTLEEVRDNAAQHMKFIDEIDRAFARVKNPKVPYCPYNGCRKHCGSSVCIDTTCECGEKLHTHNQYCWKCGKCIYCGRIIKRKYDKKEKARKFKEEIERLTKNKSAI
jgi:hypothetical protein